MSYCPRHHVRRQRRPRGERACPICNKLRCARYRMGQTWEQRKARLQKDADRKRKVYQEKKKKEEAA